VPVSYHLWLKPDGEVYRRFVLLIQDLSKEMKGPVFEPHVTLLGNVMGEELTLIGETRELAVALEPFQITLGAPDYRDTYFQCLFLHAVESASLLGAHTLARRLFDHAPVTAYMPHLSLVYGSYPVERKRAVIERLPGDLAQSFGINAVSLIRAESDDPQDWHEISAPRLGSAAKE
jgi:cyclic phosphodiesterase-like protein